MEKPVVARSGFSPFWRRRNQLLAGYMTTYERQKLVKDSKSIAFLLAQYNTIQYNNFYFISNLK